MLFLPTRRRSAFEDTNEEDILVAVRRTRIYEVFVATAICMIIAEFQKREVIKKLLEAAASEGSGNAGG